MHTMDSHWFRPIESPAKTIRPFRLLSNISVALNLMMDKTPIIHSDQV
jgi:hypothetical protein